MFPNTDGGPYSPADTEWVRDLIEMGGASAELSIISPARWGWGFRHQPLGMRGKKTWPLCLFPQESQCLETISKDNSLTKAVLPKQRVPLTIRASLLDLSVLAL